MAWGGIDALASQAVIFMWSDKGILFRMMEGLPAPQALDRKTIMIDATHLRAHRMASACR